MMQCYKRVMCTFCQYTLITQTHNLLTVTVKQNGNVNTAAKKKQQRQDVFAGLH